LRKYRLRLLDKPAASENIGFAKHNSSALMKWKASQLNVFSNTIPHNGQNPGRDREFMTW
jgi:hypothetical protein